jgi:hypothetical protein
VGSLNGDTSQGTVRKTEKGVGGLLELSREQHFTVVFLANANPNAYVSCFLILKLPPLYHTACLLLLIKSLTSCTSRDINLPGHRSLRILPHTVPPASRKQLRDRCFAPIPDPQPLLSSLLNKKWGKDRIIMLPFINQWPFYPQTSLEKLPRTALPLNRKSRSLRQPHSYQRLSSMC